MGHQILFFLFLCSILVTFSRSGIATCMLLLMMMGIVQSIRQKSIQWSHLLFIALLVGMLIVYSKECLYFFNRLLHVGEDPSALARLFTFQQGLTIFWHYPFFGTGYNYLSLLLQNETAILSLLLSSLSTLVNFGLIPCLIFLLCGLLWSIRAFKSRPHPLFSWLYVYLASLFFLQQRQRRLESVGAGNPLSCSCLSFVRSPCMRSTPAMRSSLALGHWTRAEQKELREGVLLLPAIRADIFLFTLKQDGKALLASDHVPGLCHQRTPVPRQSQSTTSPESPTGKRYIEHAADGHTVLLFGREEKKTNDLSAPFDFLGPARVRQPYRKPTDAALRSNWTSLYPPSCSGGWPGRQCDDRPGNAPLRAVLGSLPVVQPECHGIPLRPLDSVWSQAFRRGRSLLSNSNENNRKCPDFPLSGPPRFPPRTGWGRGRVHRRGRRPGPCR